MKDLTHIRRFNESEENLNISDDSDFIFTEIKTIFEKKENDMLWYIKEYFTEDEIDRHSENLLRMISGVDGYIAEIEMKLMRKNHHR